MTYNGLFNYNRKESLKKWQPFPNMNLSPALTERYNHKIETDGVDMEVPENIIDGDEEIIDVTYVKYVMLLHMRHILNYIESKGVFLGDIRQNIRTILNEIINDEVDESYYENTIEIYRGISRFGFDADIYVLMDQAIRLDNQRMIHYLIFYRQEELECWYEDVMNDYQKCNNDDRRSLQK